MRKHFSNKCSCLLCVRGLTILSSFGCKLGWLIQKFENLILLKLFNVPAYVLKMEIAGEPGHTLDITGGADLSLVQLIPDLR